MKLIGIESAPLDKTKKVLTMLNNLIKANNDFDNGFRIYDTYGNKVDNCIYDMNVYTEGWLEQTYYVTMLHSSGLYYNWICYVDKDDGYRSIARLYFFQSKDIKLCHNLEQFDLNCSYTINQEEKVKNQYNFDSEYDIHLKVKCKHKVIFNCYTDVSDSYYPLGNINYDLTQLRLQYDK